MNDKISKKQEQNDKRGSCPFFSIIIPVWNRQESIKRCLDSIFAQDFEDYEVVAVDDASDDDSVKVMKSYEDPRLTVIVHSENRGVCTARNTATANARGKWHLCVDSDWALLPGALKVLAQLACEVGPEVGLIGGYLKTDRGQVWPSKKFPKDSFGFIEYLKWVESTRASDFLHCRRAEVFETIQWPTDRRLEFQFCMRVAKAWKMSISPEVLAILYTDCTNRYMTDRSEKSIERKTASAPDQALAYREVLMEFGVELKRYTPGLYFHILSGAASYQFQAGQRLGGMRYASLALLRKPWAFGLYPLVVMGWAGPKAIKFVRSSKLVQSVFRYLFNFFFGGEIKNR